MKKYVQAAVLSVFLFGLMLVTWIAGSYAYDVELKVVYGESHADGDGTGISQLFWAAYGEAFSEENSVMCEVDETDFSVTFLLPEVEGMSYRLDPFRSPEEFSIDRVEFLVNGIEFLTMTGNELNEYISGYGDVVWSEEEGMFISLSDDPVFYLSDEFCGKIMEALREDAVGFRVKIMRGLRGEDISYESASRYVFFAVFAIWLEIGMLIYARRKEDSQGWHKRAYRTALIPATFFLCLGMGLIYLVNCLRRYFQEVGISELLYYAGNPLNGTNVSAFYPIVKGAVAVMAGAAVVVAAGSYFLRGEKKQKGYPVWIAGLAVVSLVYAFCIADAQLGIISYYKAITDKSMFYEEHYVSAEDVEIVFPEEKRNLIYIFLESMEITYADEVSGGAMKENYMPELTELAMENINFSGGGGSAERSVYDIWCHLYLGRNAGADRRNADSYILLK